MMEEWVGSICSGGLRCKFFLRVFQVVLSLAGGPPLRGNSPLGS